ncbi:hypothetical protein DL93DRAFT_2162174 [Clavulina sp. PMI_390]|nr:hypothetical protein DL93DRAFT_2162174 [Clavulina sp. PMI_390]
MSFSSYPASSSSSSESTRSLVPMKGASQSQTKNYSRACAELSTSYGFGVAPMLPQTISSTSRPLPSEKNHRIPKSAERNGKDFPGALANLQGSYGFQGVPVLPSSR